MDGDSETIKTLRSNIDVVFVSHELQQNSYNKFLK